MKDWKLKFWPFNLHLNKFHDQIKIYIGTNIEDYNKIKFTYIQTYVHTLETCGKLYKLLQSLLETSAGVMRMKDKSVVY